MQARRHEKIIHFAGFEKPWNTVGCDRAEEYWRYARETPFYERLLGLLAVHAEESIERARRELMLEAPVIDESSPMRAILDPIMPYGSRRRELARSIVQKLKGIS